MRNGKQRSIIWEFCERISNLLRSHCYHSTIFQYMCNIPNALTQLMDHSVLFPQYRQDTEKITPSPLYYHCLKARENSLFLGWGRNLLKSFLALSLNTVGFFLLLWGGFCALSALLQSGHTGVEETLYFPFFTILASIPLLPSRKSVYEAIWESRIGSAFLTNVLFFSKERDTLHFAHGREQLWGAFFAATLASCVSFFIPFSLICFFGLLAAVIWLFAFLPELLFLFILVFFPFFSLMSHSTFLFLSAMILFAFFWIWKALCGKRIFYWGIVEATVFFFGIFYIFSGIFGGRSGMISGGISFSIIMIFFLAQSLFSRPVWRTRCVIALHVGGVLCSCLGIWQALYGNLEKRWVDINRFSIIPTRILGTFSNPNFLALYLLLLLPIAFSGMLNPFYSVRRRCFFGIAFFTEGLCTVLTYTRGAWLGALIALVLFMLLASPKINSALLLSPVFLLPVIPFLPERISERFLSIGASADSSVRYRYYTWKSTLRIIKAHPFGIGVGADAFASVYPKYAISGTESVMHTHQLGLQIFLELGIVGFLVFCVFLFLFICTLVKCCFSLHETERFEFLGSACALIGTLIMGLFDHIWYHPGLFGLFWIIAALFFSQMTTKSTKQR